MRSTAAIVGYARKTLGYLDGIKPAPADVEGEASKLVKSAADTIEQPGVLLHQVLHQ